MEVKLVVASGKNAGRAVRVARERFFIGRAEDCQLRPNTDLISRHHCVITVEDGFVTVRDLGSRNGTFLNEERIRGEEELSDGDKLAVGPLKFVVSLVEETAEPEEPQAEAPAESIRQSETITAEKPAEKPGEKSGEDGEEPDLSDWLGGDADAAHDTKTVEQTAVGTTTFGKDQETTPTISTTASEAEEDPSDEDKKRLEKTLTRKKGGYREISKNRNRPIAKRRRPTL